MKVFGIVTNLWIFCRPPNRWGRADESGASLDLCKKRRMSAIAGMNPSSLCNQNSGMPHNSLNSVPSVVRQQQIQSIPITTTSPPPFLIQVCKEKSIRHFTDRVNAISHWNKYETINYGVSNVALITFPQNTLAEGISNSGVWNFFHTPIISTFQTSSLIWSNVK